MGWLDAYDRHAGNAASGNQLGFELGAVGAAASAGLGVLVVGVHVSTVCYVDTMLLHPRRQCQMGWPDAYGLVPSSYLLSNVGIQRIEAGHLSIKRCVPCRQTLF